MNEIEFSALMVSRVCHDLVGPLGAVVNGLEVLEDETDASMREDAIKLFEAAAKDCPHGFLEGIAATAELKGMGQKVGAN